MALVIGHREEPVGADVERGQGLRGRAAVDAEHQRRDGVSRGQDSDDGRVRRRDLRAEQVSRAARPEFVDFARDADLVSDGDFVQDRRRLREYVQAIGNSDVRNGVALNPEAAWSLQHTQKQ